MDASGQKPATIDAYIAAFPPEIQAILEEIRQTIRTEAPDAVEAISYAIPTFKLNGRNLVHFAAFKNHISFFPTGSGVEAFQKELAAYKVSKGTIQFPMGQPVPLDLIRRITAYRVKAEMERAKK